MERAGRTLVGVVVGDTMGVGTLVGVVVGDTLGVGFWTVGGTVDWTVGGTVGRL